MQYTTVQLLFRKWYGGCDLSEEEAIDELKARGLSRWMQRMIVYAVVPFIFVDRVFVSLDMGDPWEEANGRTLLFSLLMSAWILLLLAFLASCIAWVFAYARGSGFPLWLLAATGGGFLALSFLFWLTRGRWA